MTREPGDRVLFVKGGEIKVGTVTRPVRTHPNWFVVATHDRSYVVRAAQLAVLPEVGEQEMALPPL